MKMHLMEWEVGETNQKLYSLSTPYILPIKKFSRELYVGENDGCSTMAVFRLGSAWLGNKEPRGGQARQTICILCYGRLN